MFIVEIKREYDRAHPIDGENRRKALALRKWESLNPDRIKYQSSLRAQTESPAIRSTMREGL